MTTQTSTEQAEAAALLERAAAQGDVDALYKLAVWLLVGDVLPRDLPRARQMLRRAVQSGHGDAAMLEVALTANGSGGNPDWPGALTLLRTAASHNPIAAGQLALVEAMALAPDGSPTRLPDAEILSQSPDVQRFPGLLTRDECAHLASSVQDLLAPASVVDPATGRHIQHPVRTSHGAVIGPGREDLVIRAINRGIAAISQTGVDQGEPLMVLHYAPGQQYRPHHDGLPGAANQRIKTVLVYLNEGFGGGETRFLASGLTVAPRGGDAILFSNVRADGSIDPRSQHAGLPVTRGAKWLATRWIRERPFDPWTGG